MSNFDKRQFYEWQTPTQMFAKARTAIGTFSNGDKFFNTPGTTDIREAYTLGRCGQILGSEAVRLLDHDPPDGLIRISGNVVSIEICEAHKPGRRRGQEFRDIARGTRPATNTIPTEDLIGDADDYGLIVADAIRKKAEKYAKRELPRPIWLVVHLQWMRFFTKADAEVRALSGLLAQPYKPFDVVLVLKGNRLHGPKAILGEAGYLALAESNDLPTEDDE